MNGAVLSGRYKIIQPLGAGGMGQTFIAEDIQLPGHPKCVVKRLKPASQDPAYLATAKRLFYSEAETLQKLGRHDQIPLLLAYFEQDNEFYLVQDLIEGHPLSDELPLGQRWSEPQVLTLLEDLLIVLAFVHDQNVIHRDIKPDNIIRRQQDRKIVLIDFGAVKAVQAQQTLVSGQVSRTVAIGTPGYMPTEQTRGTPRFGSDLYAVGMIGIQALTGFMPTQLREDANGEVIWTDQAEISQGLAYFLSKMVRYHFKDRYQTAAQALQELQQVQQQTLIPPVGTGPWDTPQDRVNQPSYPPPEVVRPVANSPGDALGPHSVQPGPAQTPMPADTVPVLPLSTSPEPSSSSPSAWARLGPIIVGASIIAVSIVAAAMIWRYNSDSPTASIRSVATDPIATPEATPDTTIPPDDGPAILDRAIAEAGTSGNLAKAIEIAQSVPSDSSAYGEAQTLIQTWRDRLDRTASRPGESNPVNQPDPPVTKPDQPAPLNEATAISVIETLYTHISQQQWSAAKQLFSPALAASFDPDFFSQFEQVTVENLYTTSPPTQDFVNLIGSNTYLWPDGTIQREQRSYTVQLINQKPVISETEFIKVTQLRS